MPWLTPRPHGMLSTSLDQESSSRPRGGIRSTSSLRRQRCCGAPLWLRHPSSACSTIRRCPEQCLFRRLYPGRSRISFSCQRRLLRSPSSSAWCGRRTTCLALLSRSPSFPDRSRPASQSPGRSRRTRSPQEGLRSSMRFPAPWCASHRYLATPTGRDTRLQVTSSRNQQLVDRSRREGPLPER